MMQNFPPPPTLFRSFLRPFLFFQDKLFSSFSCSCLKKYMVCVWAPNKLRKQEERNFVAKKTKAWLRPSVCGFLDAFSHLYKRVCPSVRPSVTHELKPCKSAVDQNFYQYERERILCRVSGLVSRSDASILDWHGWPIHWISDLLVWFSDLLAHFAVSWWPLWSDQCSDLLAWVIGLISGD